LGMTMKTLCHIVPHCATLCHIVHLATVQVLHCFTVACW
jgi:hypothetical protein